MPAQLPVYGSKLRPLGVFSDGKKIFLFTHLVGSAKFQIDTSEDAFNFKLYYRHGEIKDKKYKRVNLNKSSDFQTSSLEKKYVLTYKQEINKRKSLALAYSDDLLTYKKSEKFLDIRESGILITLPQCSPKYWLFFGEEAIKIASSNDLQSWNISEKPLLSPQNSFFGTFPIKLGNVLITDRGLLLFYFVQKDKKDSGTYSLQALILDKLNPYKILKKIKKPLWESPDEWFEQNIAPIGIVEYKDNLISYWSSDQGILGVVHPFFKEKIGYQKTFASIILKKFEKNPILKPIFEHFWESKATFNPAAIYEDGKVHIIYRAIGDSDISVLGYAASKDGINIDKRSNEPVYQPSEPFEISGIHLKVPLATSPFASGGGVYGGCEDPRLTKIDDKVYMTYVAYDGYNPPRIAITSIKLEDFLTEKWSWAKPVIISQPGVIDKNACLVPEKINDKYVIFHRIYPNILIDFVDNLDFDNQAFLKGEYKIKPRLGFWDSRKIGAGPPPIKTKDGWLLIYQAVDDIIDNKYQIGAMLLDLKDPTRVIARSKRPILEPTEWYENEGFKAGVAYPCGAVVVNGQLLVYYGGADMVTCVANADLEEFVYHLKTKETTKLSPLYINQSL